MFARVLQEPSASKPKHLEDTSLNMWQGRAKQGRVGRGRVGCGKVGWKAK